MNRRQYRSMLLDLKHHPEKLANYVMRYKYTYPFSDSVFKVLLANEAHPERTIEFLNAMLGLKGEKAIKSFTFAMQEQPGVVNLKGLIYDILGTTNSGEKVLVEVQQTPNDFFMDRVLYYTARLIFGLKQKGDTFELPHIYVLSMLTYDEFKEDQEKYFRRVGFKDENRSVYSKLNLVFVEVEKFFALDDAGKLENDNSSRAYWLRFFKKIINEDVDIEHFFKSETFMGLTYDASLCKFKSEILMQEANGMTDLLYEKEGARQQGRREGRAEGRREGRREGRAEGRREGRAEAEKEKENMVRGFREAGVSVDIIAKQTGFSKEKILSL